MEENETDTGRFSRRSTNRWRNQLRRVLKLWEAQAALGWGIVIVVAAAIGTIYLAQTSSVSEIGRRTQILQTELADLKRENSVIERQIAEAQQLDQLQARTAQLGFVPAGPEDIDYIPITEFPESVELVTLDELLPSEPEEPTEPIATMQAAIWIWMQERFSGATRGQAESTRN